MSAPGKLHVLAVILVVFPCLDEILVETLTLLFLFPNDLF